MDKPAFDPSKPFEVTDKPAFDPSKPFQAASDVGVGEDTAKSLAAGLETGTLGTLGSLGDLTNLGAKGIGAASDYISDKLGIPRYQRPSSPSILDRIPTSESLRATVTDPLVPPEYQPQSELGGVSKKVGEFLPNMAGGGGAKALLTNVVAPAIGSYYGGKIGGPIGEVAGALAGGSAANRVAQFKSAMAAAKQAANATPATEDLLKDASKGFEAVKASDAVIKPSSVEQMAKDIKTEMLNEGKHPTLEGQAGVFATLDRLEAMGAAPGGVTPKDMEVIRRNLVDLKPNPAAGPTARMASDKFMEKYSNLGPNDLLNGSNPFPTLKDAIGNWAAGKRSETIQGKRNLAELNANSPVGMLDSGAGGQALQRTMKQLARPVNNTNMPVARKLGFNPEEISKINEAAAGTKLTHAAEMMDRLIPAKLGAIPAMVARQIGGLTTKRQVTALDSLVRSRSPLAARVAQQLPAPVVAQLPSASQRLLQSLVLADPLLSQAP